MTRSTRSKKGKGEQEEDERIVEIQEDQNTRNSVEKRDKKRKSIEESDSGETPSASQSSKKSKAEESETEEVSRQKFVTERILTSADKNNNATMSEEIEEISATDKNLPKSWLDRSMPKTNTLSAAMKNKKGVEKEITEPALAFMMDDEYLEDGVAPLQEDEGMKERSRGKGRNTGKSPSAKRARLDIEKQNSEMMMEIMRELKSVKEQLKSKSENTSKPSPIVKSPSDTIVYAPTVNRTNDAQPDNVVKDKLNKVGTSSLGESFENELNRYICNIRLGARNEDKISEKQPSAKDEEGRAKVQRRLDFEEEEGDAQKLVREKILEAEKYKLTLEPPKGLEFPDFPLLDDDEFMHVSCSVDDALAEKIASGRYVEFDRLLSKYLKWQYSPGEGDRLELVNRAGIVEFKPAEDRPCKIANVQMWDKAFRIFMALYTRAHPAKAHELVQYSHTIHHASSKYSWENVAYYDTVFRQMMAKNPNRNWGKIYTQMWNMAMCDPLKLSQGQGQGTQFNNGKKNNKGICWRFNKGICNYPNCRFAHKCTVCGGTNHGAHNCYKKGKRQDLRNVNANNNNHNVVGVSTETQGGEKRKTFPRANRFVTSYLIGRWLPRPVGC